MTVHILHTPAASGKTHTCIQAIRDTLSRQALVPVWAVVRDRLQAAQFRRRLGAAGGGMGVHVATFNDLYRELLESSGQVALVAPPPLAHQFTRAAVQHTDLDYYARLRDLPGFTLTVEAAIGEFKQALLSPEALLASPGGTSPSITELGWVYRAYQGQLDQAGWSDLAGLAGRALQALRDQPALFSDVALLIVDGFDSFNPAQRQVLALLADRPARILITLPGNASTGRAVHRGFRAARAELEQGIAVDPLPAPTGIQLPKMLAYMEANLFEVNRPPYGGDTNDLDLVEARSPLEEAREALRWIKAHILRDGAPLEGCAVIVPNPDLYFPHLRAAALEFGLPLRFTQSRLLVQAPAIAALLNLLNVPLLHYARRPLLDALRSPFYDLSGFSLDRRSADVLRLVSLNGLVIEGLDQWREAFERLITREEAAPLEEPPEEAQPRPALPAGEAAARLHAAFDRFIDCIQPSEAKQSITQWVNWLEDLLDTLHFDSADTGRPTPEQQAVRFALAECLRAMLLGEAVLGERRTEYAAFVAELTGLLQCSGYQDEKDPRQGEILVLRPVEARGLRFYAAVVMGLSEGIFPQVEHPDPLLDEAARLRLGLPPRLGRDQAGLFYQAVTRSDRFLLLTRPYLADGGEPWEPSPYWNAVKSLFPSRVKPLRPDDPRPLADAASPDEALFWTVRRQAATGLGLEEPAFGELTVRLDRVQNAHARLDRLLGNQPVEAGLPDGLAQRIRAQYGPDHAWSTSRLECYAACPFRFFVENALGLEPQDPPEWDFDAAQLGSMAHAILERTYRQAGPGAGVDGLLGALCEVAPREFAAAPGRYGFRPSPLWRVQQAELLDRLEATIRDLEGQASGWRPLRFEQPFGLRGAPPLRLAVDGRTINLHGVIDRIDVNENGGLRVLDYKTGGSHLAARDLIEGRRLQLAVYALAARDALELGVPEEGLYWKIGPDGASSLKLSRFYSGEFHGPGGAMDLAREHIAQILAGLEQGAFGSHPLDGKCPSYCAAANWCWRYVPEWG